MPKTVDAPVLSAAQLERFDRDGYLVLEPGALPEQAVESVARETARLLPAWGDPDGGAPAGDQLGFTRGRVGFYGSPLALRAAMLKMGPPPATALSWLYGRRATLCTPYWDKPLAAFTETPELLAQLKAILRASRLSFLDGSISRVYPGCTGEEGKLHADIAGFSSAPLASLAAGHWVLNVMVYLDDVDADLAPMRVIPGSHKRYMELNERLARAFRKDSRQNCVPQGGELYEELLPQDMPRPVPLTGKKGTVIYMHSALLHSATANRSADRARSVVILNYSNREHEDLFKNYLHLPEIREASPAFISLYQDRAIVAATFDAPFRDPVKRLKLVAWGARRWLRRQPGAAAQRVASIVKRRVYIPLARRLNSPLTRVNIGSGQGWRHPRFLGVDWNGTADVTHDLASGERLPFGDGSLDVVYSSHCLEHLTRAQATSILRDAARCLKPGGFLRVTLPDMSLYWKAYEVRDAGWFDWVRTKGAYICDGWLRLIARHFAQPVVDSFTDEQLHELYLSRGAQGFMEELEAAQNRLDPGFVARCCGHKAWWTSERMKSVLEAASFREVYVSERGQSRCVELRDPAYFDKNGPETSLFVEAVK